MRRDVIIAVTTWLLAVVAFGLLIAHLSGALAPTKPKPKILHFEVDGRDLPCVRYRGAMSCDWSRVDR